MFRMNTVIKTHHLVDLREELDYLSEINYRLNLDALWKWATIWKVVKQLGLLERAFRCVDIGGGLSPLHFIFSNYGEVINVELAGSKSAWFPVTADGFYRESPGIKHNRKNIKRYLKPFETNTVQIFMQGCYTYPLMGEGSHNAIFNSTLSFHDHGLNLLR